ncbi:fructuronate reductase [Sphingomonas naasensis]|uniref:Mannitol dehydrogenase family protein n=1 Tax=Sphingomonas naasensis TaxID=1344951 RepID=A0A4S1WG90_9SPHN|nr:mannitol dehydrogenase family protein [Sphingomonas naasensis]NIJ21406.1 fructuronate reductase [Sphingomonas naasensis]TGX41633.1 mannitol dehydrogenase family protein [Sphingomonas naasensis]
MTRLSRSALATLPGTVARPRHALEAVRTGIVHFGPGAFHRAHQAAYVDRLLDADPRWGIAAVSLRSGGTTDALKAQDGLYTLAVIDRDPSMRIIAAHSDAIGPGEGARLRKLLADPTVRIATSTVTEKGYCLAGDGSLDFAHPDIVHDLGNPAEPASLIGWIVAGLGDRHAAGTAPFAMLCCDNMTGNGAKLRAACLAFARERDPGLADWMAGEVAFPDSMVDSITPASDAAFLAKVQQALGVEDQAAVQRESFTQWVLQRFDMLDGPDFASVGVTLTSDVRGYEQAKLRILNGTHSTLAYVGLARGHETVFEAMSDGALEGFVTRLAHQDIAASLGPVEGLDVAGYVDAVLNRFRNPAIRHLLAQIAWDGSQKLPYRLLDTARAALDAGRGIERLAVPVAAWIAFLRRKAEAGETITDPMAEALATAATSANPVTAMLGVEPVFGARLGQDERFRAAVREAFQHFAQGDIAPLLSR